MTPSDLDGVADALLLPEGLGHPCLHADLHSAFEDDLQHRRRLIPASVIEAQSNGLITREKVGDRRFPGLFARAYRLHGIADRVFGQVVSLDDSGFITHVGVRLLPNDGGERLRLLPMIGWDIRMSLISKAGWFGFSRAFRSGGNPQVTTEFEVQAERWDALNEDQRSLLISRAKRLASDWQLISLGSDSNFELLLRRVVNSDRETFNLVHHEFMRALS
jgi:hypothetical protein